MDAQDELFAGGFRFLFLWISVKEEEFGGLDHQDSGFAVRSGEFDPDTLSPKRFSGSPLYICPSKYA